MLRKIRLTFAMICFVLITLLFLDFTGTLHGWFGWLAKIQFLPAVLALNVGVILFLVILTLVCGRIYCSVICPLGVLLTGDSNIGTLLWVVFDSVSTWLKAVSPPMPDSPGLVSRS